MSETHRDRQIFENAAAALKSDITAASAGAMWENSVRTAYRQRISRYVEELRREAGSGRISWKAAADDAHAMRNALLDIMRRRSTPVGRAMAEQAKMKGRPLNYFVGYYTKKLFGENARFDRLTAAERNRVFAAIVDAAGRDNAKWTARVRAAGRVGRGLLVFSLAVSVYTVIQADDRAAAAKREGAVTLGGIGGGMAGGAIAGLMCGPGAPVCVTLGAFVGGTMAAFGVDYFW